MVRAFELKQFAHQSELKSRSLSILLYLIDKMDNMKRTCYPSLATIGKQLHISLSTVKRAMKELFEKGFLRREARFTEKKNGGQTSNLYTVSTPSEQKKFVKNKEATQGNEVEVMEIVVETATATIKEEVEEVVPTRTISKTPAERVPIKYISFSSIMAEKNITKSAFESAKCLVRKIDRKTIWKEE